MVGKNKMLLLAVLLSFCSSFLLGQYKDLKFKRFSKEAGLSNSNFTCFAQTGDDYLWIGTTDGLNRFDGYSFKVYRNDPTDSLSHFMCLPGNHLNPNNTSHIFFKLTISVHKMYFVYSDFQNYLK